MRLLAALAAFPLMFAAPVLAGTTYVQTGRLLDVESGRTLVFQCITIIDERISAVGRCARPPRNATVIDWRRYTVLPGLIDLHTQDCTRHADGRVHDGS
jgi:imidazolonepropionase-like amidohydrolase